MVVFGTPFELGSYTTSLLYGMCCPLYNFRYHQEAYSAALSYCTWADRKPVLSATVRVGVEAVVRQDICTADVTTHSDRGPPLR